MKNGKLRVTFAKDTHLLSEYTQKTELTNTDRYNIGNFASLTPIRNTNQKCNVSVYAYQWDTYDVEHFYLNDNKSLYIWLPKNVSSSLSIDVCYELATPIEYDITVPEILTLIGTNNIWCDTNGDSEVSFKQGIQEYIDAKIAETQAIVLSQ